MMTLRPANHCGKADYGWLQARYAFSFGHYFDPDFMGFKTLRVLNQEVIAPQNALQPRMYPHVDILNIILKGYAQYRDSQGNTIQASEGECVRFSPRSDLSYSEQNICPQTPLTRLQLWLNACPQQESLPLQKIAIQQDENKLIASPDGQNQSIQLRQQIWINHIHLEPQESASMTLKGNNAFLQSIHGGATIRSQQGESLIMGCNDGVFIQNDNEIVITADKYFRGLLIDLGDQS
ncbi:MAG: pirin family protein [Providencia rettgeri]|uniref:pirin family protein n=1 Tax=Providencia sp. VP23HZSY-1 TaxID=3391806 RepID=UPI003AF98545